MYLIMNFEEFNDLKESLECLYADTDKNLLKDAKNPGILMALIRRIGDSPMYFNKTAFLKDLEESGEEDTDFTNECYLTVMLAHRDEQFGEYLSPHIRNLSFEGFPEEVLKTLTIFAILFYDLTEEEEDGDVYVVATLKEGLSDFITDETLAEIDDYSSIR